MACIANIDGNEYIVLDRDNNANMVGQHVACWNTDCGCMCVDIAEGTLVKFTGQYPRNVDVRLIGGTIVHRECCGVRRDLFPEVETKINRPRVSKIKAVLAMLRRGYGK